MKKILSILLSLALLLGGLALAEGEEVPEAADTPETGEALGVEEAEVLELPHAFLGEWVDLDGTCNIFLEDLGDGEYYFASILLDIVEEDEFYYFSWYYELTYDPETQTLKSASRVRGKGDFELDTEEETLDTDEGYTDAEFRFDEDGYLVWDDKGEDADDAMRFEHTVGWMDPDYVGPGHHFVGEWADERMSVSIEEDMEGYTAFVEGSGSAFDGAYWLYFCDYDPETDSLNSSEELAIRVDYAYDENGEYGEELVYEDGEAVFSFDEEGMLIWDDKKENAGEGRRFERTVAIDYGYSEAYTQEDLEAAVALIQEQFADLEGCELHSLWYAGDEFSNVENLQWLSGLDEDKEYAEAMLFFGDFHSPVEEGEYAWDPDTEYTDYMWWVARPEGGEWALVSWGY